MRVEMSSAQEMVDRLTGFDHVECLAELSFGAIIELTSTELFHEL